jgi:2-polyprenyl-6-methoxyphenol hydroxylase-like FAD-dependent oxidoreductase
MMTRTRIARIPGTAVVIGAGMAGLCAARVAAERFDRVVVLDRDPLPQGADDRPHVPQGRQPHLLLPAGARLLERWFPGILDELVAGGAVDLDLCADFHWYQGGGTTRRPRSGLRTPTMSRPFLEHVVRRRVTGYPGVTIHGEATVAGLTLDDDRGRVTGIRLENGKSVPADLVVDATGRQAHSLAWLHELGFPSPPTSVVRVDTRYVCRMYRRAPLPASDWKAAAVVDAPSTRRLAVALPIEEDRWITYVAGLGGEAPPVDEEERVAYARSLPSPVIADLMASCQPLGEPVVHRFPANQRRHVERLRRFPVGWVPLGDAVSSFDPIYGQGMTSAALQAEALGRCLDRAGAIDRTFARRYFAAAGRTVAVPWSIAVGGDFAYPDTTGRKPVGTDVLNRYMDRVTVAAQQDDGVALRVNEALAMVRRPACLLSPWFVLHVLRGSRTALGTRPEAARPGLVPH